MKTKFLTLSCLLIAMMGFAQNYWTKISNVAKDNLAQRWVQPKQFSAYKVDLNKIKSDLSKVPQRFSSDQSHTLSFPGVDGQYNQYIIQEAPEFVE